MLLALLVTQLLPVTAYAVEDIQIEARAALLVDGATGTVLLDQDAHTKQYPASITKVMTALLVFEAIDRGELRMDTPSPPAPTAWRACRMTPAPPTSWPARR